jgi:thiol-disulfide isomerase/thioredoxin
LKRKSSIIAAIALVAVLAIALFAYNELSGRVDPDGGSSGGQAGLEQTDGGSSAGQTGSGHTDGGSSAGQEGSEQAGGGPSAGQGDGGQTGNGGDKQIAPDFTALDADGREVKLSDLFGEPVVLNFWASWCPPCKSEMPEFDLVYQELSGDVRFVMLALTDGQRETVDTASKYVSDQGFSFPVYFDTKQEGAYAYGIQSIPTTFFIDKDGYIATRTIGAINEQALREGIGLIQ